jgi:hypothetical protein
VTTTALMFAAELLRRRTQRLRTRPL